MAHNSVPNNALGISIRLPTASGIQIVLYGETVMEPCLPSNSA